jgi:adenylate kinase family enzyme
MARRIHIIGSSGSGKTHAAALLSKRLGVPAFDLDDLFWDRSAAAYGVRAADDARDRRLAEIVAGDAWIIEGVYHQWLGISFDRADVIVGLVPSVWLRDVRIACRFIHRKMGIVPSRRESLRDLWKLLRWNHAYDRDNYTRAVTFVRERGRAVIECASFDEVLQAIAGAVTSKSSPASNVAARAEPRTK